MRHEFIAVGLEWVAASSKSVGKAERHLLACQACSPSASRPFASVLAGVLGSETSAAQYILCAPAECPSCSAAIVENTLVSCKGEVEDMRPTEGLVDPRRDDVSVVLVDEALLNVAQGYIFGCEHCAGDVGIAFDYILDAVTGSAPMLTEYVMCHAATCPCCSHEVTEKTLVVVSSEGARSP